MFMTEDPRTVSTGVQTITGLLGAGEVVYSILNSLFNYLFCLPRMGCCLLRASCWDAKVSFGPGMTAPK